MINNFTIAVYRQIFDNQPKTKEVTWDHFCSRIKTPIVTEEKRKAPLFSPTSYKSSLEGYVKTKEYQNAKKKTFYEWSGISGDVVVTDKNKGITRSNKNVESISMLVFDFDTGVESPDKISAPWEDFNYAIHSTFSHSSDKGKYRLIVPLKKPLSPDDFKNIWEDVQKNAGDVDQSCKDPSRMFYWPSCKTSNRTIHYFKAVTDRKFYSPKIKRPRKKKIKRGDFTTLEIVKFFTHHAHYIGPANRAGQHWVKCPWQNEHTGKTSQEDAFIYETEGSNWPTFSCSHNTCRKNERNITQVVKVWDDADHFCSRALTREAVKTSTVVKCLGYDDTGNYYYQAAQTNHLTKLKPNEHRELAFYSITADIDYWFKYWGIEDKGTVDWKAVARDMMAKCHANGFFKPTSVRGSGCWWDENRVVAHLGGNLRVGNDMVALTEFQSKYIYESAVQSIEWKAPLSNAEVFSVCEIIDQLPVPDKLERFLLSGHTVASILSGCLRWRPHIWLTGDSGSGKTTIVNNILNVLWEPIGGIFLEGRTTEPGVRQMVRHSSVPIIIDEVEANSKEENLRVESLIGMARSASSDSSADVAKGTISGSGMSFLVRSCFTFSSVVESLQWSQDKERFLVISVATTDKHKKNWPKLRRMIEETFTTEFSLKFFSRCASLAETIRYNCDIFSEAIVSTFPKATARNADQIGTHAACAWSLRSTDRLTIEQAKMVLDQHGTVDCWEKYWKQEETSFSNAGIDSVMSKIIRGDGARNYTVSEVVERIWNPIAGSGTLSNKNEDNRLLERHGMKIEGEFLWVSKTSSELRSLSSAGSIGVGFQASLRQVPGNRNAFKKFAGIQHPAIGVPVKYLFRERS